MWEEALKIYNRQTETLEGGGVVIRTDGSVESADPYDYGNYGGSVGGMIDVNDDGVYMWEGETPLHDFPIKDDTSGVELNLRVIGSGEFMEEKFLEYLAKEAGYPNSDVFVGATTVGHVVDDNGEYDSTAFWTYGKYEGQ